MKLSLQFSDIKVALAALLAGPLFRFGYAPNLENHPLLVVDTLAVTAVGH